jgi:hypothetical protein
MRVTFVHKHFQVPRLYTTRFPKKMNNNNDDRNNNDDNNNIIINIIITFIHTFMMCLLLVLLIPIISYITGFQPEVIMLMYFVVILVYVFAKSIWG